MTDRDRQFCVDQMGWIERRDHGADFRHRQHATELSCDQPQLNGHSLVEQRAKCNVSAALV